MSGPFSARQPLEGRALAAKLLITGRPGCGKTTVVRAVLGAAGAVAGGFLTEEIREGGRRLGFRVQDVVTGETGTLAHVSRRGGPRVGKYGVDVAAFERIGVGALRRALAGTGCIVIDEIGKMELCAAAFAPAVAEVFDSDHPVLATIPLFRHPFLDALRRREDVRVVEVTAGNRDDLARQALGWLEAP